MTYNNELIVNKCFDIIYTNNNITNPVKFMEKTLTDIIKEFKLTKTQYDNTTSFLDHDDTPETMLVEYMLNVNDNFVNKLILNVVKISFNNLYPQLIYNWNKNNQVFDYPEFGVIYNRLFEYYKVSHNQQLKEFLNGIYGYCGDHYLKMHDKSVISGRFKNGIKKWYNNIHGIINDNYIHFDTDTLFLTKDQYINIIVDLKKLKLADITFEENSYDYGLFLGKKKYIVFNDVKELQTVGIKKVGDTKIYNYDKCVRNLNNKIKGE